RYCRARELPYCWVRRLRDCMGHRAWLMSKNDAIVLHFVANTRRTSADFNPPVCTKEFPQAAPSRLTDQGFAERIHMAKSRGHPQKMKVRHRGTERLPFLRIVGTNLRQAVSDYVHRQLGACQLLILPGLQGGFV